MLKSKKNNLPKKDGSKRSVKEYAGGGKTGYSMIGMEKPMMMYGGKMKKYEDGGKALKPVDSNKNPGLSKLPKDVRNKMGYMKEGGKAKMKMGHGGMMHMDKGMYMKHGGQVEKLEKHSKGHSKSHMDMMKKDMHKGSSFDKSHKKALKTVGQ